VPISVPEEVMATLEILHDFTALPDEYLFSMLTTTHPFQLTMYNFCQPFLS